MTTHDKAVELLRELYTNFKEEMEDEDAEINGADTVEFVVEFWHRTRELLEEIEEKDRIRHEIRMTDDPYYRHSVIERERTAKIDLYGINED